MNKAHKIRLNPSPEQELYFRKAAGTARFVYNWGLAEWQRQKAAHPGQPHGVMAIKTSTLSKGSNTPGFMKWPKMWPKEHSPTCRQR